MSRTCGMWVRWMAVHYEAVRNWEELLFLWHTAAIARETTCRDDDIKLHIGHHLVLIVFPRKVFIDCQTLFSFCCRLKKTWISCQSFLLLMLNCAPPRIFGWYVVTTNNGLIYGFKKERDCRIGLPVANWIRWAMKCILVDTASLHLRRDGMRAGIPDMIRWLYISVWA